MAGQKLTTDLDLDKAFRQAFKAAGQMGFSLSPQGDRAFRAQKGSAGLTLILGPLLNAPCNFEVSLDTKDGTTEITIERNTPWLSGLLGVKNVKKRAKELAAGIAQAIKHEGGKVLKEWDF